MAKRRKAAKDTKDETVKFRLSSAEKVELIDAAKRDGLELSQWIRRLALKAAGALRG